MPLLVAIWTYAWEKTFFCSVRRRRGRYIYVLYWLSKSNNIEDNWPVKCTFISLIIANVCIWVGICHAELLIACGSVMGFKNNPLQDSVQHTYYVTGCPRWITWTCISISGNSLFLDLHNIHTGVWYASQYLPSDGRVLTTLRFAVAEKYWESYFSIVVYHMELFLLRRSYEAIGRDNETWPPWQLTRRV